MKITIPDADRERALERWEGAVAKVWLYHVSLRRLALRLQAPREEEVLYVVASGCERIAGPFSWSNASIFIEEGRVLATGDARCTVVDRVAGFELWCSTVSLARGSPREVDASFDDFLGTAPRTD